MEQAKGHGAANIVTVIMKSKGIDLQAAIDFIAGYCECLIRQFLDAKAVLTSRTDPVFSRDAVRWLDAVGDWIRGNDEYVFHRFSVLLISEIFFDRNRWSFVTERYFGKQNKLVKETMIMDLMKPL